MVALEDFSRVVSEIHASSICPGNWPVALTEIRQLLGAQGCAILIGRGTARRLMYGALQPEPRERYTEHFHTVDYVLDAVEKGPVGVVRGGRELVALQSNSEFEVDFMRPYEMDDGVFARLAVGDGSATFLAATARGGAPFDTPERVAFLGALVRHLEQALRAGVYFAESQYAADRFDELIDTVRHGVLIVAATGRIIRMNGTAEQILSAEDGLYTRAGALGVVSPTVGAQLYDVLTGTNGGEVIVCRRPSGRRPYVLQVVGLAEPDRALVTIVDPEREAEPPRVSLRRTFGLTATEAEVALRLMRGVGLNEIADELVVSKATVRTHLQHIFDKTDTHRQAELLRLLLTISL